MTQKYAQAFTEVYEILKLMPNELLNKIPNKFVKLIEDERDKEYFPKIKEPIENQVLKDDTIIILGLIYRDFLCDTEEKKILQENDARKFQQLEEEIKEKYNPDNIFRNRQITAEASDYQDYQTSHTEMIEYKEQHWYQKIFSIVKKLFKLRR